MINENRKPQPGTHPKPIDSHFMKSQFPAQLFLVFRVLLIFYEIETKNIQAKIKFWCFHAVVFVKTFRLIKHLLYWRNNEQFSTQLNIFLKKEMGFLALVPTLKDFPFMHHLLL